MQGLPQHVDQDSVDGCPVVEISDDPVDVEYLLKALYNPSVHLTCLKACSDFILTCSTFHCQKVLPFPVVGALVRLGRKYDFKDLFDSAVARLTSRYPTTLQAFDALVLQPTTMEYYGALDFDIVTLASENNILSVLPCAYYRLLNQFNLVNTTVYACAVYICD
jgi:hypothetical protein